MDTIDCRNASFDEWVKAVFAHPVTPNPWYWDCDFYEPGGKNSLRYCTELFRRTELLEEYLADQVAAGLHMIITPGCSDQMHAFYKPDIPLEDKVECVLSMNNLFAKYMNKHCANKLSHIDEPGNNALNGVCYMWWDIICLMPNTKEASLKPLDDAVLEVMTDTLTLDSAACQESALHGLGHWCGSFPTEIPAIIDRYLARTKNIRPELARYARSARTGCVQ